MEDILLTVGEIEKHEICDDFALISYRFAMFRR